MQTACEKENERERAQDETTLYSLGGRPRRGKSEGRPIWAACKTAGMLGSSD